MNDEDDAANSDEINDIDIRWRLNNFIKQELPHAILIQEFNSNFIYQVPVEGFRAKDFYHLIEKNRDRLHITDWGVS